MNSTVTTPRATRRPTSNRSTGNGSTVTWDAGTIGISGKLAEQGQVLASRINIPPEALVNAALVNHVVASVGGYSSKSFDPDLLDEAVLQVLAEQAELKPSTVQKFKEMSAVSGTPVWVLIKQGLESFAEAQS